MSEEAVVITAAGWFQFEGTDEDFLGGLVEVRYLVTYDIVSNRKRARIAAIIGEYGDRVQKSVFECLLTEHSYNELWQRVVEYIDDKEDRLRAYPLCRTCEDKIEVAGGGVRKVEQIEFYIV